MLNRTDRGCQIRAALRRGSGQPGYNSTAVDRESACMKSLPPRHQNFSAMAANFATYAGQSISLGRLLASRSNPVDPSICSRKMSA